MDKKDFGLLLATLRKEVRNEFNEIMTQNDLADLAKIPLITLQKIEQGRQANIKSDVLLNLSNALNLPTNARQIFFLASLGIKDSEHIKQDTSHESVLAELVKTLSELQNPAIIIDGFGDILYTNSSFLEVHTFKLSQFDSPHLQSKHNINRLLFAPEFVSNQRVPGETFNYFSRQSILNFKIMTLKYRNHWYLQKLLPELNRYPFFRENWQSPTFHNEDIFIQYVRSTLTNSEFGQLKFLSSLLPATTSQGDLYLNSFQPLDMHTEQVCAQLAQKEELNPIRVSNWPKPPMPSSQLDKT